MSPRPLKSSFGWVQDSKTEPQKTRNLEKWGFAVSDFSFSYFFHASKWSENKFIYCEIDFMIFFSPRTAMLVKTLSSECYDLDSSLKRDSSFKTLFCSVQEFQRLIVPVFIFFFLDGLQQRRLNNWSMLHVIYNHEIRFSNYNKVIARYFIGYNGTKLGRSVTHRA